MYPNLHVPCSSCPHDGNLSTAQCGHTSNLSLAPTYPLCSLGGVSFGSIVGLILGVGVGFGLGLPSLCLAHLIASRLVMSFIGKMNMRGPWRLWQFPCACSGLGGSYRRVSTAMVLRIQKSNARELQPTYRGITSVGMQNKVPFN